MPSPTQGGTQKAIRGKRASSTQGAIREKVERGEAHGNERAVIRIGKGATKVMTGQDDLSEWDDEELRRGQRRSAKTGAFTGRNPVIVPKVLHDELVRRTMSKAESLMRDNLVEAVQALTEIVKGQDVEERDRLRAIAMIMDRVMGKPQERVEVTGDAQPWQVAVNAGIVRIDAKVLGGSDELIAEMDGDD